MTTSMLKMRTLIDGVMQLLPLSWYLQIQFYKNYHRFLNIKNPKTYADKLAYLKLHKKSDILKILVDKYEVRNYVSDKIGEEYLVPLIGVYNNTDEIPWNELPQKYVLKCTHDSQSVILHVNENDFDKEKAIVSLNKHLKRNLYDYAKEYPYKNIKPRIICESFLDDNGHPPYDYKIMCFGGEPQYVIIDKDRFSNHKRDIYDINWNKLDITTDHEQTDVIDLKPVVLKEMLELARTLSEGFPHVRVDFYIVDNKIYFGEMTFFPWAGVIWVKPDKWNYKWGEQIVIE